MGANNMYTYVNLVNFTADRLDITEIRLLKGGGGGGGGGGQWPMGIFL